MFSKDVLNTFIKDVLNMILKGVLFLFLLINKTYNLKALQA